MRRIESLRPRALIIILNLMAVSLACGKSDTTIVPPSSYGGLTFELVEDIARTQRTLPANKKVQVDLRSTLFLLFDPPEASGESDKTSADWEAAHKLLDLVNELAKGYADLNAESIDLSDSNAVADFQRRVVEFGDPAITVAIDASKLAAGAGLGEAEFVRLMTGRTKESGYKPNRVYENLAYFLKKHIENLQKETERFREEKDGYELTVIALHKQAGGVTSRIHVDEYDNIPGGDPEPPRPLERYGIRMTPKELRRFRMEVEASEKAADAIREIMDNRNKIRSGVKRLRSQLKAKLENMIELLDEDGLWKQALADSLEQLKTLEDDPNTRDDVKAASSELRKTLEDIQKDIDAAKDIVNEAKGLRDHLVKGSTIDLFEIIAGEGMILATLNSLVEDVNELQILDKWQSYLDEINKHAPTVAKHLAKKEAIEEIKIYLKDLPELPKTAAFLSAVITYIMSKPEQMVKAADALEDVADQVYHDIKDPPTARIDLGMYRHLERKDGIIVKVVFRAKGADGLSEVEHMESYYLELEKLDVHTSVTASLIFARASSGTDQAKEWSPNVAAMVNWHYRIREPEGTGDELWNWLDPAAGVHLASLNQGDDTVEFGIGPSLSFWNGLLNAGYGYNLSLPEDREYFFVGLNLLHLLDVARGTASTPSWQREIDYK